MKVASLLFLITFFISCNISNVNKDEIVAEVNGEKIYLSELSSQSKQEIFDLLNTAYEIKNRVLTNLIKQKLLENTAKNKNMSLDYFRSDEPQLISSVLNIAISNNGTYF